MEGVAYGLRDSLRAAARARRAARRSGGSRAAARAATSGRGSSPRCSTLPLERTETDAGSAFGAALLAGVRAGVFADAAEAVARCVRVAGRIEPEPEWGAVYRENYGRYRALYPALRSLETR